MSSQRYLAPFALLAALGVWLLVTTVPGTFTIDEPNYLATLVSLRSGGVSLPGTEGLPPSQELAFFDPTSRAAGVTTPVASHAPPLWAWLALPFSWLGIRGLFALNTLSFLVTGALVFLYAERHARDRSAPWIALVAFTLGSYLIEYAQAIWPHSLSVALTLSAFVLAARARQLGYPVLAAVAGLLMGLAAGVRYQNAFLAACVGLTLLLWARRRVAVSAAYSLGVALPLSASAVINQLRFGSWNPISKGPGYLKLTAGDRLDNPLVETLAVFWARVVDYSTRPPQTFGNFEMIPSPESGAYVFLGAVKKAWLQSAPWMLIVLVGLALAWRTGSTAGDQGRRRELQAISLVIGATLLLFSAAGFRRTDGLCFNQRYFLEMVPLMAVTLGWSLERVALRRLALLAGLLVSALAAWICLELYPSPAFRHLALMRMPLLLALLLLVAWVAASRLAGRYATASLLSAALGACLMWSAMVHLGDDLVASRRSRRAARSWTRTLEAALPRDQPIALFAWLSSRNSAAPLQLERDLVILDAGRDLGADAPRLADELEGLGRRLFVITNGFPPDVLEALVGGRPVRWMSRERMGLLEIRPAAASTPDPHPAGSDRSPP